MRYVLATIALCTALPATAWEAGTDGPLCTLTHSAPDATVRLTYDPSVPLYTITMTGDAPWPVAAIFGMTFDGPRPNTIQTDRHVLSPDRSALSVSDRGFGNVLDGLQYNDTATGFSGGARVTVSLDGAAEPVAAFRACLIAPTA